MQKEGLIKSLIDILLMLAAKAPQLHHQYDGSVFSHLRK